MTLLTAFDILFVIACTAASVYYLWGQFSSSRFHYHWAGVLSLYWSIPAIGSTWMWMTETYNIFFLTAFTLIGEFWIAYHISPDKSWRRILYAALVLIPFIVSLFYNIEFKWDWVGFDYGSMFINLLLITYLLIGIYRILNNPQNKDVLQDSDYWLYSGLLFYLVFVQISDLTNPILVYLKGNLSLSYLNVVIANVLFSIFFIRGMQLWNRSVLT